MQKMTITQIDTMVYDTKAALSACFIETETNRVEIGETISEHHKTIDAAAQELRAAIADGISFKAELDKEDFADACSLPDTEYSRMTRIFDCLDILVSEYKTFTVRAHEVRLEIEARNTRNPNIQLTATMDLTRAHWILT